MHNESAMSLFEEPQGATSGANAPLAARMRPRSFAEFVGQSHLVSETATFRRATEADKLGSIILWGPPGVGKTTLAEIVANTTHAHFSRVSATSAGVADLRKAVDEAKRRLATEQKRTILFIDEIHRFNKAQQDAILPHVEDGTLTLIGATTENPSFEVNSALLSRSRVFTLSALSDDDIRVLVRRALESPEGLAGSVALEADAEELLVNFSNGDARTALNILELAAAVASDGSVTRAQTEDAAQRRVALYDKGGEMHFDLISALHKSVRGSDPDASLYWLARMLEGGEDPLYLARRLVRMAVEDIGLADPHALTLAMSAQQAVHFMGLPEGALALAQLTVYLAAAPKSNRIYEAFSAAKKDVEATRNDPVPLHLRNAPTKLMKEVGYGEGYRYAHEFEGAVVEQQNRPDAIQGHVYYKPSDRGHEQKIAQRLAEWREALANRKA